MLGIMCCIVIVTVRSLAFAVVRYHLQTLVGRASSQPAYDYTMLPN